MKPDAFPAQGVPVFTAITASETAVTWSASADTGATSSDTNPCNGIIRWYDPITGRWLSNDPIGISGGLNQYVFCANNPVNFVDPFGLNANTISMSGPLGTADYEVNYYGPGGINAVQGAGPRSYARGAAVAGVYGAAGVAAGVGAYYVGVGTYYLGVLATPNWVEFAWEYPTLARWLPFAVPLAEPFVDGWMPGPPGAISSWREFLAWYAGGKAYDLEPIGIPSPRRSPDSSCKK
ncbi:MAG: RHS repeat-associated core domain-containing protein [bacterium]